MKRENVIEQLKGRYGEWNFGRLTDLQLEFLNNPHIKDNKDGGGFHTVRIMEISPDDLPTIKIEDVMSYIDRNHDPRPLGYSSKRMTNYKSAAEIAGEPERKNGARETGGVIYSFTLSDSSSIEVEFDTVKDTV